MEIQQLVSVLQACMSPDQGQRSTAEGVLKQHEKTPGQATNLLRITAEPAVDAGIRQFAAISFKNLVKSSWDPPQSDANAYRIPDAEKVVVRSNLLESLIRSPHSVQVQLGEVLRIVVYADHPQHWPDLVQALTANLMAQDVSRVHGALYGLRILARKYEFRDEEDRGPLTEIITTTFPVLLHIFQQLLNSPQTPEVCLYTKLVCKTFWSATYMGIPDQLLVPEQFNGWMQAILQAITATMPEKDQAPNREDRPMSHWWKSRKWVFHIAYRFLSRYGNPKHCKEGNDQQFAVLFKRDCMMPFMEAMLTHVKALASGVYMSPRVINLIFQYLSICLNMKDCYKQAANFWDDILCNVAFPLMCFSDEDATLWEEDPQEWVRKGYDILEDMYSPKTAVGNFAHDLCSKKQAHLDRFLGFLVQVLQQFHQAAAANGGQVDPALARRMDGALLAIGTLTDLLKNKKLYKNQLGSMLLNMVVPVFGSSYGHLRAKAVWVAGVYSDAKFPDGQGAGPSFNTMFEKAVAMLADPELPVRVDTVVALRHFIDTAEDTEALKPLLPTLLNNIFSLMNQIDAEDLVFSLEALVDKFGSDMAPYAAQMVAQLVGAFEKYTAAEDDEEDEDDAAGLAAYGCMRALNTVLESVCGLGPELFPALEEGLYPLLYKLLSSDGHEVMEEVLELLAYLTYFGTGISPRLWSLWPRMHAVLVEFGIDFWENLLVPLDNMICRDTATFVTSKDTDYLTSAYQMAQFSLTGDYDDREVVHAARLLEVVLQACRGHVDNWVQPYISLALQRLAKTEYRKLQDELVLLVANCLYYNPVLALQALESMGATASFFTTWFNMISAAKPSGKMKHFRRLQDKKVCTLGLTALLSVPDAALPASVQASKGLLLLGLIKMLAAHRQQEEELAKQQAEEAEESEAEEEEGEDIEDDGDWGADDDEEDDDGNDDYMKRLEKQAKKLLGQEGEEDDSDDEWTDDEDNQTPLDPVDPYILLADTLAGLAATQPAQHQALIAACAKDAAAQANLQGLLQHAEAVRQQKAQQAANGGQ